MREGLSAADVLARPGLGVPAGSSHDRILAAAAYAHALAAEAERCIAEVAELLDADPSARSTTVDGVLLRDVRLRARAAAASAHDSTGDTAAAATGLAIALRRLGEFSDLHRQARQTLGDMVAREDAEPPRLAALVPVSYEATRTG
jgi:hypothetical protein